MSAFAFGISFEELYSREGLVKLDGLFLSKLQEKEEGLHAALLAARETPLTGKLESELLIQLGPHVEDFIADLFQIKSEVEQLSARHHALDPVYACKRLFVQRRAAKEVKEADAQAIDGLSMEKELQEYFQEPFTEESFSRHVMRWSEDAVANAERLTMASRYAAWALYTPEGKAKHAKGVVFHQPKKLDPLHLVYTKKTDCQGVTVHYTPDGHERQRDGFALTDPGADLKQALDEANYCIFCHNQGKDSCSKGLKEKDGSFKQSPLGVTLAGCPLEEKISEMHTLKSQGYAVGALAMIVVDNPMCAGTGHRICNDCMKSCIYQKQEPVDIPQAETRTLKDVLQLPYGFEIYSLLTRWNPLNLRRPVPKAETGYKVLVAGMGPAGYTLAHHLLNDGHTVVGIDGLKLEPLDPTLSGVDKHGKHVPFEPIRDVTALLEPLEKRAGKGFGGVAEYGITVRWDKNFLTMLRLLLERRAHFSHIGGVRFGGTITIRDAWEMGFDHLALCMGAGKPTLIDMPNALARGVRTASDFLMALQLTGAAREDSIANLQLRLPAVVIGGGLTAVDTATEAFAYYPVQVEKYLKRFEQISKPLVLTPEEQEISQEFIAHARVIRAEKEAAKKEGREPNILKLLQGWGGVTLAYRKTMQDAPSYRLNHEEVELALEEGIGFAENCEPIGVEVDAYGHASGLKVKRGDLETILPARAILMAAGTSPNTVLAREEQGLLLDGKYFQAVDDAGNFVTPERISKPADPQVLMNLDSEGRAISFFGDLHPSFAGNVVKAMGSAKQGYPKVSAILHKRTANASPNFLARINEALRPVVVKVERLTPTIIEVIAKAPMQARNFLPGQFYRLQNLESEALNTKGTTLAMEGLALTGAWVDKEKGLLSTIVLEMGGSSDLCAFLKPGEAIVLMGPTGTPTETPSGETVLLVGGGLGNAVLFSIGKALRAAGSKVLYFAGYKKMIDRYKVQEIEDAADAIVWCSDEAPGFAPNRPQDSAFVGNIVEAMKAYGEGKLGKTPIALSEVNRIIAIGSDRMMAAVGAARHGVLNPYLQPNHEAVASINSPMQCMMKEICAQCLQKHEDPLTGKTVYIYSCFNQDQPLDQVDFPFLRARLGQNALQEKLTAAWIDDCLRQLRLRHVA